ncbi:hypothetical protein KAR91_60255 [Candidatus Pacearchaeota archaeon]|nr:hypothetical protein [Candidatus Pacearchaeota archaeon]
MALTPDIESSPIVVTGTTDVDQKILGRAAHIKFVHWYKPTTIGHLLSLKNKDGRVILAAYCDIADRSQWLPVFTQYNSIHCADMDSGKLYIYIS